MAAVVLIAILASIPALDGEPRFAVHEIDRIRLHLDGAERVLLARNLDDLTPSQRAARARAVAHLREYRMRGVFPHNHHVAGRTPVFLDEHGTRCAMAHLIEATGEMRLVERIAATRNLARIRELADDAELLAWLDRNGIRVAEAARIQPAYDGRGSSVTGFPYEAGEIVAGGLALAGAAANLSLGSSNRSCQLRGGFGVVTGMTAFIVGTVGLGGADPDTRVMGGIDMGLGALAFGLGVRQLESIRHPKRPMVAWTLWHPAEGSPGLAVHTRF